MKHRIIVVFMLLPLLAHAEHVFEGGLHVGASAYNAQTTYVMPQAGLHIGGQIYYNYFSTRLIGIRTGVSLDHHNAGFGKINYEDTYSTVDVDNEQMEISYNIGSLKETHSTWSVGIPLQLAFAKKRFAFFIGPKAVFPLASSWKQKADNAALSVYYPAYDNRVYESYPLACSRDFSMTNNGKMKVEKVQWWLSAEFSYAILINSWARNYRSYIMVGAYFDYCFSTTTASRSNAESLLMLTDTRDGFPLQRVMTSVVEANRQGKKLVRDYSPYDVGIKISYAIAPFKPHKSAYKTCHCFDE